MFFTKTSLAKQSRQQADNLLRMGEKVDAYRWDILPQEQVDALRRDLERVREIYQDPKAETAALDAANETLHNTLVRCGGSIYPVTFWGENIEMLLVAAILAIGVRSFFLQPFKIPTNSMYPTYYGMTSYVYKTDDPNPGSTARVWNFLVLGAKHYDVVAPTDGEVVFPLGKKKEQYQSSPATVAWAPAAGHKWLVLPEKQREYTLQVGDLPVKVNVPADFSLDEALFRTYFPEFVAKSGEDPWQLYTLLKSAGYIRADAAGNEFIVTGQKVAKGGKVLNFDLRTGDMLFVDRLTYNFSTPTVGDPFVFSTRGIPELDGGQLDNYFIKRLVGEPADVLEVRSPVLYRNGQPIQDEKMWVLPFTYDAKREHGYPGYVNYGRLPARGTYTVLPGTYFAMGDNSPVSMDSRYWGGVPAKNVVGRALVIVYPFTSRWGLAQ